MLTGIYQSAAILTALAAFYVVDFALIARYDRQRSARGSGRSWDFTLMAAAWAVVLIGQPLLAPGLGLNVVAGWGMGVQLVGAVSILGGLGLHWWARRHLRHFYAERVEIQPGHRLVDSGPYRYVRHPLFTSFFMLVGGMLLVNPSLPTLIAALYTVWDFGQAARQEEALLSANLPGYGAYMAQTARFVPPLSSLMHGGGRGR